MEQGPPVYLEPPPWIWGTPHSVRAGAGLQKTPGEDGFRKASPDPTAPPTAFGGPCFTLIKSKGTGAGGGARVGIQAQDDTPRGRWGALSCSPFDRRKVLCPGAAVVSVLQIIKLESLKPSPR